VLNRSTDAGQQLALDHSNLSVNYFFEAWVLERRESKNGFNLESDNPAGAFSVGSIQLLCRK